MSCATAQCPAPTPRPAAIPMPCAQYPAFRAATRSAAHPVPRAQCPAPMPRVYNASNLTLRVHKRQRGRGTRGARGGRWRSRTFSPAALAAGAFPAVADAFEWEPDTLPKNRLPVELALKLNLQLLEPRPELLPRLLSPPAPSPAFSIARRSSESQTEERQERRPSPAEAFSCAALTPWLG